jgi:hypothetical protein
MAFRAALVVTLLRSAFAQPPIGTSYVTNITMEQVGSRAQSGVMWALNDWTLFAQDKPATEFPYQLNLGDHGGQGVAAIKVTPTAYLSGL